MFDPVVPVGLGFSKAIDVMLDCAAAVCCTSLQPMDPGNLLATSSNWSLKCPPNGFLAVVVSAKWLPEGCCQGPLVVGLESVLSLPRGSGTPRGVCIGHEGGWRSCHANQVRAV